MFYFSPPEFSERFKAAWDLPNKLSLWDCVNASGSASGPPSGEDFPASVNEAEAPAEQDKQPLVPLGPS